MRVVEINLGGGMAVDDRAPGGRFDWSVYAAGLAARDIPKLRIEPGPAVTAYHGWYVTDVLDVKTTRGETYVVLGVGTHHTERRNVSGGQWAFNDAFSQGPSIAAFARVVGMGWSRIGALHF